ncbi:MAG: DinB family protein [Dehalococcoidia bacterium]|nr:DinB family protein [Dehalococcoidia bacterium]
MHADAEHNMEATHRLDALVGRLSPEQLVLPLGGGWTVSMALGHLAFWDGRQRAVFEHFLDTGVLLGSEAPAPHDPDDQTNEALEPLLALLDPDAVGDLVVEAAQAVDELVATLTEAQIAAVLGGEHGYVVRRWRHREEHIAQIEAAVGPAGG